MKCIKCDGKTSVIDSRSDKNRPNISSVPLGSPYRRRECEKCGFRYSTFEIHTDDLKALRDRYRLEVLAEFQHFLTLKTYEAREI